MKMGHMIVMLYICEYIYIYAIPLPHTSNSLDCGCVERRIQVTVVFCICFLDGAGLLGRMDNLIILDCRYP